jgi:hypothetical protein
MANKGKAILAVPAPCPLHGRLEDRITTIIDHQLEYMGKQVKMIADVQSIKDTVENGLKSSVKQTAADVKAMHEKIIILEDFGWFRIWITKMRDNLFKIVLKYACLGGLIVIGYYILIVYGEKVVRKISG